MVYSGWVRLSVGNYILRKQSRSYSDKESNNRCSLVVSCLFFVTPSTYSCILSYSQAAEQGGLRESARDVIMIKVSRSRPPDAAWLGMDTIKGLFYATNRSLRNLELKLLVCMQMSA